MARGVFTYVDRLDRQGPRASTAKPPRHGNSKQRRNSKLYNLTLDVATLRQQIHQLSLRRAILFARIFQTPLDLDGSLVKTALAYAERFRHGFEPYNNSTQPPPTTTSTSTKILTFVPASSGRQTVLDQWRRTDAAWRQRCTECFAIRVHKLLSIRVNSSSHDRNGHLTHTLRVDALVRGVFTRQVFETVFPSLLEDHELTQQLLGKKLIATGAFYLHFDRNGAVVGHDAETNFFSAFARVLGSPARATTVLKSALNTERLTADQPSSRFPAGLERGQVANTRFGEPQHEPATETADCIRQGAVESRDERHNVAFLLG